MAAALRKALIFQLNRRGPGAFQQPHGALHVQRVAEAGIGVHHHRQRHPVAHPRAHIRRLGHGHQPDIGRAELGVGDGGPGQVHRFEPGLLGKRGRKGVVNARAQQRLALLQPGREAGADHWRLPAKLLYD